MNMIESILCMKFSKDKQRLHKILSDPQLNFKQESLRKYIPKKVNKRTGKTKTKQKTNKHKQNRTQQLNQGLLLLKAAEGEVVVWEREIAQGTSTSMGIWQKRESPVTQLVPLPLLADEETEDFASRCHSGQRLLEALSGPCPPSPVYPESLHTYLVLLHGLCQSKQTFYHCF